MIPEFFIFDAITVTVGTIVFVNAESVRHVVSQLIGNVFGRRKMVSVSLVDSDGTICI